MVPGSPHWPESRLPETEEIGYAEMKRGPVLTYPGSVIQAGGENRSNGDCIGTNIAYAMGWLRQEENRYLSCPPSSPGTSAPQAPIAYSMGSYALGDHSPPGFPGEAPEAAAPEYALSGPEQGWSETFYKAVVARKLEKERAEAAP